MEFLEKESKYSRYKAALIFILVILIFAIYVLVRLNSKQQSIPTEDLEQSTPTEDLEQNTFHLDGKILYRQEESLVSYDLQTRKNQVVTTQLNTEVPHSSWAMGGEYIFYFDNKIKIIRRNLDASVRNVLKIELKDCVNQFKNPLSCIVTGLFPSPDGSKLAFVIYTDAERFGMGSLDDIYILKLMDYQNDNFTTIKESKTSFETYEKKPTWFNDNRFLYVGDTMAYDVKEVKLKKLEGLKNIQIYPGASGSRYLWFDSEGMVAKDRGIFDFHRPNLVNSSLTKTFSDIFDHNQIFKDLTIPFLKFPVIARDFKAISNVAPAKGELDYILEIRSGNGKKDIFFTNCGGTFKKLNPNNSDSYYFIAYLPSSNQVLASRVKEERFYRRNVIESRLVLLSADNYSEFVSDINNDSSNQFYEKELLIFEEDPFFYHYVIHSFAISPDEKYLIMPISQGVGSSSKPYYVVSLENEQRYKLDQQFGTYFYWLSD